LISGKERRIKAQKSGRIFISESLSSISIESLYSSSEVSGEKIKFKNI